MFKYFLILVCAIIGIAFNGCSGKKTEDVVELPKSDLWLQLYETDSLKENRFNVSDTLIKLNAQLDKIYPYAMKVGTDKSPYDTLQVNLLRREIYEWSLKRDSLFNEYMLLGSKYFEFFKNIYETNKDEYLEYTRSKESYHYKKYKKFLGYSQFETLEEMASKGW